jgi:hypothetical protein
MFNSMNSVSSLSLRLSGLVLLLAGLGTGCASGPGSASFASVVIHKHSPAEIHAVAGKVFREDGFIGVQTSPTHMLFEKEASRMASISRDGFIATQSGARTRERVRTELVDLGGGSYRLQCEAFMVSDAGDPFFEDEVRKLNFRSGPYRSLLNKVAKELE